MRIGADAGIGELGHIGLGHDHRAARPQAAYRGRVGGSRLALLGQQFGAGARHFAGDVEQILDADNGAIERPQRNAGTGAGIGGIRRRRRRLAIDGETGAPTLAFWIGDAVKRLFESFTG